MRLPLNLATHPYEDARKFYSQWVPLLVLLAVLAVGLTWYAAADYMEYRRQNRELDDLRAKIAELQKVREEATRTLALPDNAGTRDQSMFLNYLIRQKAFSWTQVMADLEKIMPAQVKVSAIKPSLSPEGRLEFTLTVITRKRDSGLELVRRMEGSPRFLAPELRNERTQVDEKTSTTEYAMEIGALYQPVVAKGAQH